MARGPKARRNHHRRQALWHAIDTEALSRELFGGLAQPINSYLPPWMFGYTPDVPRYEFSIAKANQLLDAAGLTKDASGVRLRITHDSNPFGGENNRRISAYFKQQMALLGIKVDIRAGDTVTFIKRVYTDYDFDTTSTQAFGLSDPTIGVQRFYWSKNIVPGEVALYRIGDDHVTAEALLPMLASQYEWNFPPDRYRASRDASSGGGLAGSSMVPPSWEMCHRLRSRE